MTNWLTKRGNGAGTTSLLQREINRLFDSVFDDLRGYGPLGPRAESWFPAMDVAETDDAFLVTAELPGVDPKNVQITAVGNELTIKGELLAEQEQGERTWHCRERRYGNFFRSLSLPSHVSADQVKAVYRNGILHLTLPKREEARPRAIKVEVAS